VPAGRSRACRPRDAGRVDDEGHDEGHAAEQEDAAPPDHGDTQQDVPR
jgi:hypothetical protein